MAVLTEDEYRMVSADVCGNCGLYMTRRLANLRAKELNIRPKAPARKIFYGTPQESICFHSGIHTSAALKAGCKFYERSR